MSDKKTSLADIYRAAGLTVTDDGFVDFSSNPEPMPFDIVLTVVPAGISYEGRAKPKIEFDVVLMQEMVYEGTTVYFHDHDAQISLPVDQVRIHKE